MRISQCQPFSHNMGKRSSNFHFVLRFPTLSKNGIRTCMSVFLKHWKTENIRFLSPSICHFHIAGSGAWRLDNLGESNNQSQVNSCCQSNVLSPVRINWLVSLISRFFIGCKAHVAWVGSDWSVSIRRLS